MRFSENLKYLRTEKGYSQKQLGEIIGVSYSAVSLWELGLSEPKLSYIVELCKVFNISFDQLIGNIDL